MTGDINSSKGTFGVMKQHKITRKTIRAVPTFKAREPYFRLLEKLP